MAEYTFEEYADMVYVYGFCDGNAAEASREYQRRFPQRRHPTSKTFVTTFRRLREKGTVSVSSDGRGAPVTHNEDDEENIIDQVLDDPSVSTRRIATRLDHSQMFVWRILKQEEMHPYHLQRVQCLNPGDHQQRLVFCRWMLNKLTENPDFFNFILWTDEAQFTRDGMNNFHNFHQWSVENPRGIRNSRFQNRFSVNIWGGIFNGQILNLQIINHRLQAVNYFEFLQNHVMDILDDIPLDLRRQMYYQQDGAPPHNGRQVRELLNNTFGEQWIGNLGPVRWPPRSPDLNPLDFYLWGHLKQLVYRVEINTREQLIARIFNAAAEISDNRQIVFNVYRSLVRRCQACVRAQGGHFEHLL